MMRDNSGPHAEVMRRQPLARGVTGGFCMFTVSARPLLFAFVTAGGLLGACAVNQPAPDARTHPEEAEPGVGPVIGACNQWEFPGATGAELVTVDAYFGWSPGSPWNRPREEDLQALRAQGAHILYLFRVPVARLKLQAGRLAALQGLANHARVVADPERPDVLVNVIYRGDLIDSDLTRIQQLGGRVLEWSERFRFVRAVLPDSSIPHVQSQAGVAAVEMGGTIVCPGG